jgi:hypothetical protein
MKAIPRAMLSVDSLARGDPPHSLVGWFDEREQRWGIPEVLLRGSTGSANPSERLTA